MATRQDADFALRASKAYQDIVDALRGAHEAAGNASIAADIAFDKVREFLFPICSHAKRSTVSNRW